jgi:hypothetical protein
MLQNIVGRFQDAPDMLIQCLSQSPVHVINIDCLVGYFVGRKVNYTAPRHCYDKNAEKGYVVFCTETLQEIINSFVYTFNLQWRRLLSSLWQNTNPQSKVYHAGFVMINHPEIKRFIAWTRRPGWTTGEKPEAYH